MICLKNLLAKQHVANLILTMFDSHNIFKTFALQPSQVQFSNHATVTDKCRIFYVVLTFKLFDDLHDRGFVFSIALLNRNKPTAYIIPAETYEKLMDVADDLELGRIIEERKAEKADAVEVSMDEL